MDKKPIFTVDWETWHDAISVYIGIGQIDDMLLEPTLYILDVLKRNNIKAIFYVLGITKHRNPSIYKAIVEDGHIIKSHGFEHSKGQKDADRQPYAILGPCGGFWMRFLPYSVWKWFVLFQKHCYIHPHDVMTNHPNLINSWFNWKRHINLKSARVKLERLLKEVKFNEPR